MNCDAAGLAMTTAFSMRVNSNELEMVPHHGDAHPEPIEETTTDRQGAAVP